MPDLLLRDAFRHRAVWFGASLVTAGVAFFVTLCLNYLAAILTAPPSVFEVATAGTRDEFVEMGANMLLYSGVPAVFVLAIVLSSVAAQTRDGHALWRLGGASPRQILGMFVAQSGVAAAAGAVVGALASLPAQATFNALLLRTADAGLPVVHSPLMIVASTALIAVLGMIAAVRPAVRASRVSPVEAMRAEDEPRRAGWKKIVVPAAFTVLVVLPLLSPVVAVAALDHPVLAVLAMLPAGQAFVLATALFTPLILRGFMRTWTALPALLGGVTWTLARHMAITRAGASSATVAPLMVGIGLFCSFSMVGTTAARVAPAGSPPVNLFDGTAMLAPVGIISAIGSAAVVYMSSRRRNLDVAALRCAGATEQGTRAMFLFEALIYVVSAVLLTLVPLTLQVALLAVPLAIYGQPLSAVGLDITPALTVALIGGVATTVIVSCTGMAAWARPLTDTLRKA